MSVYRTPSESEQARCAAAARALAEGLLRGLAVRYPQFPHTSVRQPLELPCENRQALRPAIPRMPAASPVANALLRLTSASRDCFSSASVSPCTEDNVRIVRQVTRSVEDSAELTAVETEGEPLSVIAAEEATVTPAGSDAGRQVASVSSPQDRRAFPRRESHCQVIVSRPDIDGPEGSAHAAWQRQSALRKGELLDISLSGAAFSLPEQPAQGERLGLRLKKSHSHMMFDTWATVVRTSPDESRPGWLVFCQFERTLPFEQVLHFGHSLHRSSVV